MDYKTNSFMIKNTVNFFLNILIGWYKKYPFPLFNTNMTCIYKRVILFIFK